MTTDLTPREREIVRLVALGLTNVQVAQALWLSARTVQSHLANAMAKTQSTTRTGLAVRCIAHGVVDLDELLAGEVNVSPLSIAAA